MNNQALKHISDFGNVITGKTPSSSCPEDFGGSILFVTPPDFTQERVLNISARTISDLGASKLQNKILQKEAVMVTCIGNIGNVAMTTKSTITNQQINSIVVDTDKYSPHYIYYLLKNSKRYLTNKAGQTVLAILGKTEFEKIELPVFTNRLQQQKIASVLSSLDSKIELNNKINVELEAMAKIIYDYWFVQFDFPDKNGKPYKSSGGKMVWKEELKREIPEGWEVKNLENIERNIITGKTPPTSNGKYFNGDVPFICIGDVRGNMHIVETEITLTQIGAATQSNKFIPKGAICVTCIASPGLVAFATKDSQTNQQLNTIVCKEVENRYYLYFYLKDYFKYSRAKTGNTFANMNKGDFSSIKVLKPKKEILTAFSTNMESSINKILSNSIENQQLASLRDWLLPMLMNGQVKVN
jgi:type I restriction enzyme S subunit